MQPTVPTVLLLPTTYYRLFFLSLHTTPERNSNSAVTSRCTPQQGMKLLHLMVQTTTGTYSTSLNFPPASDVSQLIVYILYPAPTLRWGCIQYRTSRSYRTGVRFKNVSYQVVGGVVSSVTHISELSHRVVRSQFQYRGCLICS